MIPQPIEDALQSCIALASQRRLVLRPEADNILALSVDVEADRIRSLIADVVADARKAVDVLHRNGFVRCDIPACNCDSWHHVGGYAARFREIDEVIGDHNGKTLLDAVKQVVAERDAARAELAATEKIVEHCVKLTEELGRPFGHDLSAWMRGVVAELDAVKEQRDDLLAAAKDVARINNPFAQGGLAAELRLRQAIAAAKQPKPARVPAIHWSDAMHPEFSMCGVVFQPHIKRSLRRRDVTCGDCLSVDEMARQATEQPNPGS